MKIFKNINRKFASCVSHSCVCSACEFKKENEKRQLILNKMKERHDQFTAKKSNMVDVSHGIFGTLK